MAEPENPLDGTGLYLKMFEEKSPTIGDHYAMVGLVASNWAYFEAVIDDWTLRLAHIQPEIGACLTAQITGSGRKLDAFISLLRFLKIEIVSADDWDKLAKKVAGLAEQRNRAVHDPWFFSDPNKPMRFEVTARKKLRLEMISMSTEQVAQLADDLSPEAHPIGWRVRSSFEPNRLGGATGRGAEPRDSSSAPSRCMPGVLSFANVAGGTLPRALCGLTVL